MAWLSRVNFISSDTLSFTDINNLGNDIRAWGDNVNGGGYTLSNVVLSASSGTMATVTGGTDAASTLTIRSTSGTGTSDAIVFQTASQSERMRITSGGNVGIGTPSPVLALHVVGTQGGPATSGTTPTGTARFVTVNSVMDIGSRSNGNTWMQVADRTNLAVSYNLELNPNGGNVGIGRTPAYKFDVNAVVSRIGDTGVISYLQLGANATDLNNYLIGCETGSFVFYQGKYGGTAAERMRIDSSGNVGIGTASPAASARLEIAGTTGALLVPRLTTTERNALTAVNGMIIYNTTDNQMQGRINGAWVAM